MRMRMTLVLSRSSARCPSEPLLLILLADRGSQPIVVGDELADELVQAELENLVHPAVLDPGADAAGLALCRSLAAIGAGDLVEITHQVLIAARKRPRHLVVENEQI